MTDIETAVEIDVAHFVDALQEMATANEDEPVPLMAGTFACYPMEDGAMMFVTDVTDGPMAGLKHTRIPPSMIRAVAVIAGGGSKIQALKALTSRKAIGGK
jgi:hypothetical protein